MTKEEYDKIISLKQDKYNEKLQSNEINPFQRIVRNWELTYDWVKAFYKNSDWTLKLRKRICKGNPPNLHSLDVRNLIKTRNRLLEDQRMVEKWRLTLIHPNFTPTQLSIYFKDCQKMYSDYEYSYFNTFKIPKLGFFKKIKDNDIMEDSDSITSENKDEDVGLTWSESDI